jgi:hypothetical protein
VKRAGEAAKLRELGFTDAQIRDVQQSEDIEERVVDLLRGVDVGVGCSALCEALRTFYRRQYPDRNEEQTDAHFLAFFLKDHAPDVQKTMVEVAFEILTPKPEPSKGELS